MREVILFAKGLMVDDEGEIREVPDINTDGFNASMMLELSLRNSEMLAQVDNFEGTEHIKRALTGEGGLPSMAADAPPGLDMQKLMQGMDVERMQELVKGLDIDKMLAAEAEGVKGGKRGESTERSKKILDTIVQEIEKQKKTQ